LGRHDAGNAGHGEGVTLLQGPAHNGGDRLRLAGETRLRHGPTPGDGLFADIDDMGLSLGIEVGEALVAHQRADTLAPWSRVRVAATTSSWRIRLSPTRKVPMPTWSSSMRICSWVMMPLSLTRVTLSGSPLARLTEVSSEVSKVRRLRLLMPMNSAWSARARSISSRSCTSTSASMPHSLAESSR